MITNNDLGDYKDFGFTVSSEDNAVILWFNHKYLAQYNSNKITVDRIKQDCKNYLINILKRI